MSNEEFSGLLKNISADVNQLWKTLPKLSLDRLEEIQKLIVAIQKATNQDKTSQSNSVKGFTPTQIKEIKIGVTLAPPQPSAISQPKLKEFCEKLKDIDQTELESALQTVSIDGLETLRSVVGKIIESKKDEKGLRKEASPC